eukprot:1466939-Prymnesium_polylepis.1
MDRSDTRGLHATSVRTRDDSASPGRCQGGCELSVGGEVARRSSQRRAALARRAACAAAAHGRLHRRAADGPPSGQRSR